MVNFGMHKQDIMHKELCVGGAYNDISCFSPLFFSNCLLVFRVLAPNGFVIRLSLFNEDTNEDTIN